MKPGPDVFRLPSAIELRGVGRIVEIRIEIRQAILHVVGVRNDFPTEAQVQRQPVIGAPVVGDIKRDGGGAGVRAVLQIQFVVALGVTQQEIGHRIAGKRAVETVVALRIAEDILVLSVAHVLAAEFHVVLALWSRRHRRAPACPRRHFSRARRPGRN